MPRPSIPERRPRPGFRRGPASAPTENRTGPFWRAENPLARRRTIPNVLDLTTLVSLTAGTLMTGIAGWLSARAFSDARLLAEIGSTPMGELSEGLHEVRGTVKAENAHTAPMSERPCVGWHLIVEQQRRSNWETVYDSREIARFELDDDTGTVQVDGSTAELVLARTARVRNGVIPVPSPEWDALRARLGAPAVEPSTPFLRWREESIEPVDVLTAIGSIVKDEATGAWRTSAENLLISDRDDAEVVRQQRRRGQRHALWVLAGLAVLAFGVWSLISSLTTPAA